MLWRAGADGWARMRRGQRCGGSSWAAACSTLRRCPRPAHSGRFPSTPTTPSTRLRGSLHWRRQQSTRTLCSTPSRWGCTAWGRRASRWMRRLETSSSCRAGRKRSRSPSPVARTSRASSRLHPIQAVPRARCSRWPERASLVNSTTDLTEDGYLVNYGNSWVMVVDFVDGAPNARAVMTYSQVGGRKLAPPPRPDGALQRR